MAIFWSWFPYQEHLPSYSYTLSRNILILLIVLIFLLVSLIVFKKLIFRKSALVSPLGFTFAFLWIIFIIGNISLLAVSFIFTNPLPDLNPRTLLPVQFGLVFALLALFSSAINEFHLPIAVGWSFACLVLILIFPNAKASWNIISQYHQYGAGYTNRDWHNSTTLRSLQGLPSNIPLISNQSAALLLLADRSAYDFCTLPCNQPEQLRYGDNLADPIQQIFREDGAALILFYPYCGVQFEPWYANTLAQFNSLTQNLTRFFSSCDGVIFFYPSVEQY
jgi:hypothetical protein